MKEILTLMICLMALVSYSQEDKQIKTRKSYSLRDTVGVNFSDSLYLDKWKTNKKIYDREGLLIEDITYPFPYNPSYRKTVITRTHSSGDTLISTTMDENNFVAKHSTCISLDNYRECRTIDLANLTGSYYKKYERPLISIIKEDSIKNHQQIISLYANENSFDTIRVLDNQIVPDTITQSHPGMEPTRVEYSDTTRYNGSSIHAYTVIVKGDSMQTILRRQLEFGNHFKLVERFNINYQEDKKVIFKSEALLEGGKVMKVVNYIYKNGSSDKNSESTTQYNEFGDIVLTITDDYREGVFAYRFVSFVEYEYY